MKLLPRYFLGLITLGFFFLQVNSQTNEKGEEDLGYRIEQPGTITFTVGVKIKGKIEKPQVIIFLRKEKTIFRDLNFNYSFQDDLDKSLPFEPVLEY